MNEPLHPLTLGEVLDRTAHLYRSRFLVYFGIGVIPAGTVLVFVAGSFAFLAWVGSGAHDSASAHTQIFLSVAFIGLLGTLALPAFLGTTALGWAALIQAAARAFLGETISIRDSYKSAWKHGWRYVWFYLLLGLIVAVAPIAVFALATGLSAGIGILATQAGAEAAAELATGGAVILVTLGLAVYVVLMLLCVCMAFPASVVEQIGAWAAVKRAYMLSKGTRGRIFLLFLLGAALGWILAIGFSVPLFILLELIPGINKPEHSQLVGELFMLIWYGMGFAVQVFTKPVYAIALTLFYFDRRIRNEGFDIERMMERAGLVPLAPQQAEAVPWLAPPAGGLTEAASSGTFVERSSPALQTPEMTRGVDPT